MALKIEPPDGLSIRRSELFDRQAAAERWEAGDSMNANRWLTRLRDEFDVYELVPVADANGLVGLQAWSRTLHFADVKLREGPAWPLLQALADLWFLFATKKVNQAALCES